MLKLPRDTRIYLAATPIDMRRSFDGTCAIITGTPKLNPLDDHFFLFPGRNADRIKVMYWDRYGLVISYKRQEKGRYQLPAADAAALETGAQDLSLLLDAVDFTRLRRLPVFYAWAVL